MKMRTFIHVKPTNKSVKTAHHARYISERERDPEREEPQSRPVFTHDRDGLKHYAADRYLAGGKSAKARTNELHHVIIAFNAHDARELEKLGAAAAAAVKTKSSTSEDRPDGEPTSKNEDAKLAQVARDRPFAEAVRLMMKNLEERTDLSDLRYAMAVHRHTAKTHVHLLLRREYTSKETGEPAKLQRLPEQFLNGRDELGKAKAGLLDESLSAALDRLIPRRQRPARTGSQTHSATPEIDEPRNHHPLNDEPDDPVTARRAPRSKAEQQRAERETGGPSDVRRLKFVTRSSTATAAGTADRREPATALPTHTLSLPAQDHPTGSAAVKITDPAAPSNLQNLNPNLQPILQSLQIPAPQQPQSGPVISGREKNFSASKIEPAEAARPHPQHLSPETLINSRVTNRASDQQRAPEKQKSSHSRGR